MQGSFIYIADDVSSCVVALSNNLFTPVIIVPGIPTAGENFAITCRLDGVVERLATRRVTLALFGKVSATVVATDIGTPVIVSHQFTPVRTSDAGSFTCDAIIHNIPTSGIFISEILNGELLVQSNVLLLLH